MDTKTIIFCLTILSLGNAAPIDDSDQDEGIQGEEHPSLGGKDVIDYSSEYQKERELEELERERAAAAKYHFMSNVQDGISDLTQQREEVRDGLKVKGFYSYSDGHFKRKVTYEADEKGYRVIRQDVEPLSGPKVNPEGRASVHTKVHGNEVVYTIQGDDNVRRRRLYARLLEEQKRELEAAGISVDDEQPILDERINEAENPEEVIGETEYDPIEPEA